MKKAFNPTKALQSVDAQFRKPGSPIKPLYSLAVTTHIRKPYCYVMFHGHHRIDENEHPGPLVAYPAVGFSKCNPGDTWDQAMGLKIAFKRAVRDYVKQAKAQTHGK